MDSGMWDASGNVALRREMEQRLGLRYDVGFIRVVDGVHIWHVDWDAITARGDLEPNRFPWRTGGRRVIYRGTQVSLLPRVLDVGIDVEPAFSAEQGYAFWGDQTTWKAWKFTKKHGSEGMLLVYDADAVQSSECDPAVAPRTYTDSRGRVHGTRFGPLARNCRENEPRWGFWFPGSPRPHLLHIVLNCGRAEAEERLASLSGER